MIEHLKDRIGRDIVVDYSTNSGSVFYAKGNLIDIQDDFLLIRAEDDSEEWYVRMESVLNIKIRKDE